MIESTNIDTIANNNPIINIKIPKSFLLKEVKNLL